MLARDAAQQFAALDGKMEVDDYNFAHFRTKHLLADLRATLAKQGVRPGDMAPDFALPRPEGGSVRLSELRGRPVLLHFGSFT